MVDYKERDELVKKQLELLQSNTSDENLKKVFEEVTTINRHYNETQSVVSFLGQNLRMIQLLAANAVDSYAKVHGNEIR